jgi:hypothetical protein
MHGLHAVHSADRIDHCRIINNDKICHLDILRRWSRDAGLNDPDQILPRDRGIEK